MTGKILDERYELIEKIGSGGMADVYKAKDILLDRIVAVKILHSSFAEDNDFIVRFRHEAQSAGKLSHPNIVGIYDVGCDGDVHYIVMEYVEGETLKQYIQNHPNIPIDTAVRIAIEIGYALEEAHANGIIHCDIKPHNVLLTRTGKVKVTDFGIARAINSSTVLDKQSILGSVHYLSPEQAAGDKITAKTDIYSLGIVLYEMLTHHLPFEGETAVSIALQHMQGDIPRPTKYNPAISPMLEECLLTALQKDPDKRYDTVSDFISELKIAQGFTTTIYKPASHDFTAMTRPIPKKEVRTHKVQRETKLTRFITNLPQKYIWIGMAVLFIICFAWAFFSFGNFWSSENITVPNVVGKPVEVAETTLKKLDLKVSVDEIASDDVPAGQVISQTPAAGTNVKARRIIHLTVSKGGSAMLIPDLKGLTLEQAKERLDKMGLTLGAVENGNDPDKPSDVIISQSPESGAKATKGTRVNIVINMKQKVHVPNVVGMTLADARNTLLSMKLSVGTINASDGTSTDDSAVRFFAVDTVIESAFPQERSEITE
jgi:eukaryotic-like serine/threonine-protein kinase